MWHWIADLHLGHANIIKYCNRPFLSSDENELNGLVNRGTIPSKEFKVSKASVDLMDQTIIDSINATVDINDTLVIDGDFCWTPKHNRFSVAKNYRDRIKCKNVYLIWGNHDDSTLAPLFRACYDHYTFNVNGQHIFVSHYPARSWDKATYECWMLYGHVHNLFYPEDNGNLMPYDKLILNEGFDSVLQRHGIQADSYLIEQLMNVCASLKGIDLTLDIGVDNLHRGTHIPFGTPWSMDDIRSYMNGKRNRWLARQSAFKNLGRK